MDLYLKDSINDKEQREYDSESKSTIEICIGFLIIDMPCLY